MQSVVLLPLHTKGYSVCQESPLYGPKMTFMDTKVFRGTCTYKRFNINSFLKKIYCVCIKHTKAANGGVLRKKYSNCVCCWCWENKTNIVFSWRIWFIRALPVFLVKLFSTITELSKMSLITPENRKFQQGSSGTLR